MTLVNPHNEEVPWIVAPVDAKSYASAILNILADSTVEKETLSNTQRAILNILDDSADEKERLGETLKAILNILDDFDAEKKKVERINAELRHEVAERVRAVESLSHANAEIKAANSELETFAFSVSHDLRAPLRAIDGFSQALAEDYGDKLDGEAKLYLTRLRHGSQTMAELIDGILKLSRATRGEMRHDQVDLSCMAAEIAERLRSEDPKRNAAFNIAPGLMVVADARMIRAVMENLLDNAWKFTSKNPETIIDVGGERNDARLTAFVRDNGAGFDMIYADKLFAPFQRLHRQEEFSGIGIGLSTVERILLRHGGRAWAESTVGNGATFYFELPCEVCQSCIQNQ